MSAMEQNNPNPIIQEFLNFGDRNLLGEILESQRAPIVKCLSSILPNQEEVLDVLQESYLKIMNSLDQYDYNRGSFTTWSVRIAIHTAYKHLKKNSRRQIVTKTYSERKQAVAPTNFTNETNDHSLLETIPAKYRIPLSLKYIKNYTINEIAELLSFKEKKVQNLLHRGLEKLRAKYNIVLGTVGFSTYFANQTKAADSISTILLNSHSTLPQVAIKTGIGGSAVLTSTKLFKLFSIITVATTLMILNPFRSPNIEHHDWPYLFKLDVSNQFPLGKKMTLTSPSGQSFVYNTPKLEHYCDEEGLYTFSTDDSKLHFEVTKKNNPSNHFYFTNKVNTTLNQAQFVANFDDVLPYLKSGNKVFLEPGTTWHIEKEIFLNNNLFLAGLSQKNKPTIISKVKRVITSPEKGFRNVTLCNLHFQNSNDFVSRPFTFHSNQFIDNFELHNVTFENYKEGGCYFISLNRDNIGGRITFNGCQFINNGGQGSLFSVDQKLLVLNCQFSDEKTTGHLLKVAYPNGSVFANNEFLSKGKLFSPFQIGVYSKSAFRPISIEEKAMKPFLFTNNQIFAQCDYLIDTGSALKSPIIGTIANNHYVGEGKIAKVINAYNAEIYYENNVIDLSKAYHPHLRADLDENLFFKNNTFIFNEEAQRAPSELKANINNSNEIIAVQN